MRSIYQGIVLRDHFGWIKFVRNELVLWTRVTTHSYINCTLYFRLDFKIYTATNVVTLKEEKSHQ